VRASETTIELVSQKNGPEEKKVSYNPNAKGVQEEFKYCRNCGNKLPILAKLCDKGGTSIDY
jgi:hypothetical protein